VRWLVALLSAGLLVALPGRVTAATPSAGQAAYEKANALFVAKKFPESLAAIEEALRLDPKLLPALTLKAKLAMAANRYDVARQTLERAVEIAPAAAYPQFLYGLTGYLTNDMKEALPRFQKARQLNPKDSRAALYLGLTTESLGEPNQALGLYQEAVKLATAANDLDAGTLLPGARLLMLLGRLEESERWLRQAVKLSPASRDAHFELARLWLKQGNAQGAAAEGEAALGLSDGVVADTAIRYLLVRAWQQSGNRDRAASHAAIIRAQEAPAAKPAH
jgi:tetratricopeptide (TPR) repeat protein